MINSLSFTGNFAAIITTIVSEKKIIWTIEIVVTTYLAPIFNNSTLSAINNTGKKTFQRFLLGEKVLFQRH